MSYTIGDLVYNGEQDGVHKWQTISGMHFYWHPDWMHIAEDETGHKAAIELEKQDTPHTQQHILQTIIHYLSHQ